MHRSRQVTLERGGNMQVNRQGGKAQEREVDSSRREGWGQGRSALMGQHVGPGDRNGPEGASPLPGYF